MPKPFRLFAFVLCVLAIALNAAAQQPSAQTKKSASKKTAEADPLAEVRRTTAITLVSALADEARNFNDSMLRARVQARSADTLWDTDKERARALFRRAWEAAEAADHENERLTDEERRARGLARQRFGSQPSEHAPRSFKPRGEARPRARRRVSR
jgi:hypothetical protein